MRSESLISLKGAKSADNPSPSPSLRASMFTSILPLTVLNGDLVQIRTQTNSCVKSSSSRRNSPSAFNSNNYDETHKDEDLVTPVDRDDNDEPLVHLCTVIKKYLNQSGHYPSSIKLSLIHI